MAAIVDDTKTSFSTATPAFNALWLYAADAVTEKLFAASLV